MREPAAVLFLIALGVVAVAGMQSPKQVDNDESATTMIGGRLPIQGEGGIGAAELDFTGALVPVLERDAIRSIDDPPVIDGQAGGSAYSPDEIVLGVAVNGEARAYPLRILGAHEIVNDNLGGKLIAVTFCPLCYTGVVYERRAAGIERRFGTSGYLLNSSLVMFDRERESLWSQVTGEAVSGADKGAFLTRIPAAQTTWEAWQAAHPDTSILELEALGGDRRYPPGRFDAYYSSSQAGLIPLRARDDLPAKTLVAGVRVSGETRAYPITRLAGTVINEELAGVPVAVWFNETGSGATAFDRRVGDRIVTFEISPDSSGMLIDPVTGQTWSALDGASLDGSADLGRVDVTVSFWFGWAAFFPNTGIWDAGS